MTSSVESLESPSDRCPANCVDGRRPAVLRSGDDATAASVKAVVRRKAQEKLALFIAGLGGGGAERVFVNLAKAFSREGHSVDVVVGTLDGAAYLDELPADVRLVDLKVSRMAFGGRALIRYMRRERPFAVLATGAHSSVLAVLARQVSGVHTRVVVRESNMTQSGLRTLTPFKRLAMSFAIRHCYPRADHVIAVSGGVADELNVRFGIPRVRLSVVYSPLVSAALKVRALEPVDHEWFQEGGPPVVLSVGRLTAKKDQQTLIRAFARVRQSVAAKLVILGEGEQRPALESLVSQLGLRQDVSLPGFQENPFAYMARALLFVLSSASEGLPGVLIQALACGCSVISTDCPSGPREILRGGRLGRLVPVGDAESMAEAILEGLTDGRKAPCPSKDLQLYTVEQSTRESLRILLGDASS